MSPKHWLLTLPLLRVAPSLTRLVLLRKHSIPTRRIIRRPPRRRSLSSRKDARRSFVSRPLSARHAGCPTQTVSRSQSNPIMVGALTSLPKGILSCPRSIARGTQRPLIRKERVRSHDILYKMYRDILYTLARA